MYNRYVPGKNGYVRIRAEERLEKTEAHAPSSGEKKYTPTDCETQVGSGAGMTQGTRRGDKETSRAEPVGDKFGGLNRLLGVLKLENVDHGDLLLFLILLLLLTDGDELDMVITLGLLLLLGLGDQKNPDSGLSGFLRSL